MTIASTMPPPPELDELDDDELDEELLDELLDEELLDEPDPHGEPPKLPPVVCAMTSCHARPGDGDAYAVAHASATESAAKRRANGRARRGSTDQNAT